MTRVYRLSRALSFGVLSLFAACSLEKEGTGGDRACTPGVEKSCYTGPAGTSDQGVCRAGVQTCKADGSGFGECLGDIVPVAEVCSTADIDEDCDGTVGTDDHDCNCTPDVVEACTTDLPGVCAAGTRICKSDGMGFEACIAEVMPSFDDCATMAVDEDCDGDAPTCTGGSLDAASLGSGGPDTDEVGFGVATDGTAHVVVGVQNSNLGDFEVGLGELFVVKYDDALTVAWKKSYAAADGYAVGRAVALDSMGNIVVAGEFNGTLDIEGTVLESGGNRDIFLAKFDPSGALLWAHDYGDDGSDQAAYGVAVNGDDDIFVTGVFDGKLDFGSGSLTASGLDAFVAKIGPGGDGAGLEKWSKRFNGDGALQIGWSIAAAPDGNVVVAGEFEGDIDFGGGALKSKGGRDVFVAKLNSKTGDRIWRAQYGDSSDQQAFAVSAGASGEVAVAGTFAGEIIAGSTITAADGFDAFVIDLAPDGAPRWAQAFGDADNEVCTSVAMDGAGHVLVTGHFDGSLPIGANTLASAGERDIYVAKLSAQDGAPLWSYGFGNLEPQRGWAVAADPQGNALVTGAFYETVDFGAPGGPVQSDGWYDLFLLELAP